MVNATIKQSCHYLGRLPANVKFEVEQVLEDGSYLSWINPDGKSRKQGAVKIQVRIIEYKIDSDSEPKTYRLITSLMDIKVFPALLLAVKYYQRWEIEGSISFLQKAFFLFIYSASVPARTIYKARERGRSGYKCKTEMLPNRKYH
jgi:Transposase DDE domain